MKLFTHLLLFTILFLVVKPGLDFVAMQNSAEIDCCAGQCKMPESNDSSQKQNQDDDCHGESCNPFQGCCACVFMCITNPFTVQLKPLISAQLKFYYQSTFVSQYAPDFWQPPKIA